MSKRKYRTTLLNGTAPEGDKAWCVHCDEYAYDEEGKAIGPDPCKPHTCDCECHTKARKPKCLCAVVEIENPWDSPVGCCRDCDCFCHVAEQKEADRTKKKRDALWKAELKRQEDERFKKEGVHDWEKKVLEYLLLDPSSLDFKYRSFLEALAFSDKAAAAGKKETGTAFMKRMATTPWGSVFIDVHRFQPVK